MARTPEPPIDLQPTLAAELAGLSAHHLRETIIYAQEFLQHDHQPGVQFTPGPGEEVVRIDERDGYTAVRKREPCGSDCADCPHGPYLSYVTEERHPDGETTTRWTLIDRVAENGEDA